MIESPAVPAIDGVQTVDSWRMTPAARCLGCKWRRVGEPAGAWLAIRAAAHRHAGSSGHAVHASVTIGYTYQRAGGG